MQHHLLAAALALQAAASTAAPTGTLRATFLATNPVQARTDPRTGTVTGPVADLAKELARRLGVPLALTPVPDAAAVIDSLESGRADIGFLAVEAARAQRVDFSDPYLLMGNAYLVRADAAIGSSADVDRAGTTVGAVKGQSQEIFVSANLRRARIEVMPAMPDAPTLVTLLRDKKIDVFAANRQRMEEIAKTSSSVRVLADDFLVVGQAIVVPKGNRARLDEMNRFIADVVASGLVQSAIQRASLGGVSVPKARK